MKTFIAGQDDELGNSRAALVQISSSSIHGLFIEHQLWLLHMGSAYLNVLNPMCSERDISFCRIDHPPTAHEGTC